METIKMTNDINMKNLDVDFTYDVLSIPTYTGIEDEMVEYICNWANNNGIKHERDSYGNLYLTKGEIADHEYYPCVTAHLDTVHKRQKFLAAIGLRLDLCERITEKGHEVFCKEMGIGADDKAGIIISLSLFNYFDKLKACFFLEEETNCQGSQNLNTKWFENVGYVIGWDSPERNRSAYACAGELLFSKYFFKKVESVCEKNGLTNFYSEPFTDVEFIRKYTGIICMNIGNGGYNPHQHTEYVVLEHMDEALGLGIDLITTLGLCRYSMPSKNIWFDMNLDFEEEDIKFFSGFSDFRF